MKFRNPFQSAIKRNFLKEAELKLYEKVAKDIENNDINNGVWTKAFAKSNGDVAKQKSIYIELMVELYEDRLRAEEELEVILASAANKEKAEKQEKEAQQQARQKEAELKKQKEAQRKKRAEEEAEETKKRHEKWKAGAPERERKQKQENRFMFAVIAIFIIIFVMVLYRDSSGKSDYEMCIDLGSPEDYCEKAYVGTLKD